MEFDMMNTFPHEVLDNLEQKQCDPVETNNVKQELDTNGANALAAVLQILQKHNLKVEPSGLLTF